MHHEEQNRDQSPLLAVNGHRRPAPGSAAGPVGIRYCTRDRCLEFRRDTRQKHESGRAGGHRPIRISRERCEELLRNLRTAQSTNRFLKDPIANVFVARIAESRQPRARSRAVALAPRVLAHRHGSSQPSTRCRRSIQLARVCGGAPKGPRRAFTEHPRHIRSAQPCGFRLAVRCQMGPLGFEPRTKGL